VRLEGTGVPLSEDASHARLFVYSYDVGGSILKDTAGKLNLKKFLDSPVGKAYNEAINSGTRFDPGKVYA
jgi:hypothetical protein